MSVLPRHSNARASTERTLQTSPSPARHDMSQVIISVQYAWKEGVDASTVAAAHKKLVVECCAPIAGCRIFRYGLDEPNRRSQSYEVYDSPAAVQALLKSAMADGSPLMPMYAVCAVVPGSVCFQGTRESLETLKDAIAAFGGTCFYTDSQEDSHFAV